MLKLGTLVAAVGLLALQIGPGVAAGRQAATVQSTRHSVSCQAERAVKRDGAVIVYAVRTSATDGEGDRVSRYSACRRPRGVSVVIGHNAPGGGEYSPDVVLEQLAIGGNFAGSLVIYNEGSTDACTKYLGPSASCPVPPTVVTLADVDPAVVGSVSTPGPTSGLVISSAGAAAWISEVSSTPGGTTTTGTTTTGTTTTGATGSAVTKELIVAALTPSGHRLKIRTQVAASGDITDVHLNVLTLTWSQDGQPESLNVARPTV